LRRYLRAPRGEFRRKLILNTFRPGDVQRGILLVTRPDLFPADHGAAVRIDRTAWALSKVIGPVYIVTDSRSQYYRYLNGNRQAVSYPTWLKIPGPVRPLLYLRLRLLGIPKRDAFLYYPLADWGLSLRALYVAARTGSRVFQAEFPGYARVCLWLQWLLGGRTVLVEHNVEFARMEAQVRDLGEHRYELLREIELALCRRVDLVVAVSKLDRDTLLRNGIDEARLEVVPHGVDLAAFDAAGRSREFLVDLGLESERPVLVYHGTYAYPPNIEALRILSGEILPRLQDRGLDPLVLAIGPHPPATWLSASVVFLGSVRSVAPFLKAADVAVVPLRQGGGTRMKILDYLAAGLPVVTTAKGAEGLDLVDDRDALIRDSYDSMADAVALLLRNTDYAAALGARGRQFVAGLDWLSIGRRYREVLRSRSILGESFFG